MRKNVCGMIHRGRRMGSSLGCIVLQQKVDKDRRKSSRIGNGLHCTETQIDEPEERVRQEINPRSLTQKVHQKRAISKYRRG